MDKLLETDRELFDKYAIQDAVITLIHSWFMEEYNFNLGGVGIPVTISSMASRYLKSVWSKTDYKGYQVSPNYLLSDMGKTMTPKGISAVGDVGLKMGYFISNYKGRKKAP
jgi:hypothetical protein